MDEYTLDELIGDVIDIIDYWEAEGLIPDQPISEGYDHVEVFPE